jgi:hypothetical protein
MALQIGKQSFWGGGGGLVSRDKGIRSKIFAFIMKTWGGKTVQYFMCKESSKEATN